MNILYIIGNGFDMNLGLNTRYKDFYNYYQTINSQKKSIQKLKKEILDNYQNWSDLELAIGNYTENLNSTEEFDEIFEDIIDKLAEYLEKEENLFDFSKVNKDNLFDHLVFPEKTLLKADEIRINALKENYNRSNWKIDLITLNYTSIIEKIVDFQSKSILIGKHHNDFNIYLKSIEHIHGYLDDRMVVGVNDLSQIKNTSFHQNYEVVNALIKSNANKVSKHTIDDLCKNHIEQAHLICIFGSSIGDTDNIWWELIGERLMRGCHLIIFAKSENTPQRFAHKKDREIQKSKTLFLSKTKLTESEKNSVSDRIFVGVNTDMFKL